MRIFRLHLFPFRPCLFFFVFRWICLASTKDGFWGESQKNGLVSYAKSRGQARQRMNVAEEENFMKKSLLLRED